MPHQSNQEIYLWENNIQDFIFANVTPIWTEKNGKLASVQNT